MVNISKHISLSLQINSKTMVIRLLSLMKYVIESEIYLAPAQK